MKNTTPPGARSITTAHCILPTLHTEPHQELSSQLSSLTIAENSDSEEDLDDRSINETIAAYEGPAALPPPMVQTQDRRLCFYVVTTGRRTGIFSSWYVLTFICLSHYV